MWKRWFVVLLPLLIVTGCGTKAATHAGGTIPSARHASLIPIRLITMHMVTADAGWALGLTGTRWRVFTTKNGGRVWQNASPGSLQAALPFGLGAGAIGSNPFGIGADFVNRDIAWVFAPASVSAPGPVLRPTSTATSLNAYYTSNSGRSWSESPVTTNLSSMLVPPTLFPDFRSATQGWVLVTGMPATIQMPKAVYETTNGGVSWTPVALETGDGTARGNLSYAGFFPNGIAFNGTSSGFMTAQNAGNQIPPLFHTVDGGRNWQFLQIPVPAGETGRNADTFPPVFFGPHQQRGLLPVQYYGNQGMIITVYRTTDGGLHWSPTPGIRVANAISSHSYSFVSARTGWILVRGVRHLDLFATRNGGLSWTRQRLSISLGLAEGWSLSSPQIDFVSRKVGWALVTRYCGACLTGTHPRTALFQTRDGGRTWTPVSAQIQLHP